MGQGYILYAVVNAQGVLRRNRHRSPMIYEHIGTAKAQCAHGDSVVQ